MEIVTLIDLFTALKGKPVKRLVAVNAIDDHTLDAVNQAVENGFVEATLTGDR